MTAIKITKSMAKDLLDFFDNGNHDIYNKKQGDAFDKLRKTLEDLK